MAFNWLTLPSVSPCGGGYGYTWATCALCGLVNMATFVLKESEDRTFVDFIDEFTNSNFIWYCLEVIWYCHWNSDSPIKAKKSLISKTKNLSKLVCFAFQTSKAVIKLHQNSGRLTAVCKYLTCSFINFEISIYKRAPLLFNHWGKVACDLFLEIYKHYFQLEFIIDQRGNILWENHSNYNRKKKL